RDDQTFADVRLGMVGAQIGFAEAIDRLESPSERGAEGMVGEAQLPPEAGRGDDLTLLVELVEQLFADDAALELDVGEERALDDLGQERQRWLEALSGYGDRECSVIGGGARVQGTAEIFEGARQGVRGRVQLSPSKQHVLEEMANARGFFGLEAAAGAQVHRDDHAANRWHVERCPLDSGR